MGIERLVLLIQEKKECTLDILSATDIYVATLGEKATHYGSQLVHMLRRANISAAIDYSGRSLKAQMKMAGKNNSRFTLILGDQELETESAILRNMTEQEQQDISLQGGPAMLVKRLKEKL